MNEQVTSNLVYTYAGRQHLAEANINPQDKINAIGTVGLNRCRQNYT